MELTKKEVKITETVLQKLTQKNLQKQDVKM